MVQTILRKQIFFFDFGNNSNWYCSTVSNYVKRNKKLNITKNITDIWCHNNNSMACLRVLKESKMLTLIQFK